MTLKRYDLGREYAGNTGSPAITRQPNGAYVRHDDHQALADEWRAEKGQLEQIAMAQTVTITELRARKCDGNHGGPRCADPGCWNDSPQAAAPALMVSEPVKEASDDKLLQEFLAAAKKDGITHLTLEQPAASVEPVAEVACTHTQGWTTRWIEKDGKRNIPPLGALLYAAPVAEQPSVPDESAALEHFEQRFRETEEGDGDIPLPKLGDGKPWDEYVERHKSALTGWVLRREYEQSQKAVDKAWAQFQAAAPTPPADELDK